MKDFKEEVLEIVSLMKENSIKGVSQIYGCMDGLSIEIERGNVKYRYFGNTPEVIYIDIDDFSKSVNNAYIYAFKLSVAKELCTRVLKEMGVEITTDVSNWRWSFCREICKSNFSDNVIASIEDEVIKFKPL